MSPISQAPQSSQASRWSSDGPVVGFVGAGAMGGAVCRRLAAGGHRVRVFDLSAGAVAACVAAGAEAADSAADAVGGSDVVFTSLPTPELVAAFWEENLPHLAPDAVAVDLSTIDPATSRRVADRIEARGASFLACTLGRTPGHAENGDIPAFVGGDPATVERVRPLLDRLASSVHPLGDVEAATTFKLVSNLVGMTNLAVLAEGYVLARRAGIEPEAFAAALEETGAGSFQSQVRLPWIMADDLAARFSVDLAAKDVRLAVEAAARWSVPTPVAAAGLSALVAASAAGHGRSDAAAVVETYDPRRTARGPAAD
ncbi:NAD-binding protein [Streptomyces sp. 3MP-14]|uniref:NAD-binding protein n=1 Tax=Streptomyces mimosae TaxID=2586635 RepID=A0A5N6A766_9ACTN|nr:MULTISPECIES: NAD(P)-dependent oxidoreductase [Streptomyces]KAB8163833.1 NAD-binding protein [Streptomyces mimosae]KAB8175276.1 NAD-binding protein [Streptomyces sp. 3MP-14]